MVLDEFVTEDKMYKLFLKLGRKGIFYVGIFRDGSRTSGLIPGDNLEKKHTETREKLLYR